MFLAVIISENTSSTDYTTTYNTNILPDARTKTIFAAKTLLKDSGFNVKITGNEDENNTLIIDQVPKPGVKLIENSTIYLYTSNNNTREVTNVPDFRGMSSAQVLNSAHAANINVALDGSGTVVSQDVAARN